ncbi:MAG TPA: polysaccharide biosynthesis/export family protein [Gemmatimonadota bacterium]|nr:polysaccharide biosynthesis/export family protein [Gemmatimonadota bacterium]
MSPKRIFPTLMALWLAVPAVAFSQDRQLDPGYVGATRESLRELQTYYEAGARSQAYSPQLRAEARVRADAVRQRLQQGDFRAGDRIVLAVMDEPILNDTFVVEAGPEVDLPALGRLSLQGVLRTELTDYFTTVISSYINNPTVRARSYVRVQVTGEVGVSGFHTLPAETPITEAIMAVGGPSPTADLSKAQISRGGESLWTGEALQVAIRQGRTLDEMDIQDGDEIYIPRRSPFSPGEIGRTILVLSGAVVALSALFR